MGSGISGGLLYEKQLLGEVFVISRIMKVEVRTRLITRTKTLIIPDITKNKSNHDFIMHCFEIHNVKYTYRFDMALGNNALSAQPTDQSCRVYI